MLPLVVKIYHGIINRIAHPPGVITRVICFCIYETNIDRCGGHITSYSAIKHIPMVFEIRKIFVWFEIETNLLVLKCAIPINAIISTERILSRIIIECAGVITCIVYIFPYIIGIQCKAGCIRFLNVVGLRRDSKTECCY